MVTDAGTAVNRVLGVGELRDPLHVVDRLGEPGLDRGSAADGLVDAGTP